MRISIFTLLCGGSKLLLLLSSGRHSFGFRVWIETGVVLVRASRSTCSFCACQRWRASSCGDWLTWFLCGWFNFTWNLAENDSFLASRSIDVVFGWVAEIDLDFGRNWLFSVRGSTDLVLVWASKLAWFLWGWSKLAWFQCAELNLTWFQSSEEIDLGVVWDVEIDLISVWGIGIDFDLSVETGIDLGIVWGSKMTCF